METKEYKGEILRLTYPASLRIKAEEPDWYGFSSKPFAQALVMVDPPMVDDLKHSILNPRLKNTPNPFAPTIVREGDIRTAKGLVGYERVIRSQVGGTDTAVQWDWLIGVRFQECHAIKISINTVESMWYDGTVWRSFLDSIEIVSTERVEALRRQRIDTQLAKGKRKVARVKASIQKKPRDLGALAHLPLELTYLIEPALVVGSLPVHELEDNPALIEAIEECLKKEMRGLTKAAAAIRVKADREELWAWLQQYPANKYPETLGLYGVYGALLYTDGMAFIA